MTERLRPYADGPIFIPSADQEIAVPGCHLNLPEVMMTAALEAYRVEPATPLRVFCGEPTAHLLFDDDVAADTALPAEIEACPEKVSRLQARLALQAAGLLSGVEAAFASLPASDLGRIYWQDVSELHRWHPLVMLMGPALGLAVGQINDLFRAAKTIV